METLGNKMVANGGIKYCMKYSCEKCDYKCSKESDFNKHLATRKHKTAYIGLQNSPENSPQHSQSHIPEKTYDCVNCAKKYVFRQSLYNHNKKCKGEVNGKKAEDEIKSLSNIVFHLVFLFSLQAYINLFLVLDLQIVIIHNSQVF